MIANLPTYMCAENYRNRAWFDKVIAKIKWCSFFTHMVDVFNGRLCQQSATYCAQLFNVPSVAVSPVSRRVSGQTGFIITSTRWRMKKSRLARLVSLKCISHIQFSIRVTSRLMLYWAGGSQSWISLSKAMTEGCFGCSNTTKSLTMHFFCSKYTKNVFVAKAPPQSRLGSLQHSH